MSIILFKIWGEKKTGNYLNKQEGMLTNSEKWLPSLKKSSITLCSLVLKSPHSIEVSNWDWVIWFWPGQQFLKALPFISFILTLCFLTFKASYLIDVFNLELGHSILTVAAISQGALPFNYFNSLCSLILKLFHSIEVYNFNALILTQSILGSGNESLTSLSFLILKSPHSTKVFNLDWIHDWLGRWPGLRVEISRWTGPLVSPVVPALVDKRKISRMKHLTPTWYTRPAT